MTEPASIGLPEGIARRIDSGDLQPQEDPHRTGESPEERYLRQAAKREARERMWRAHVPARFRDACVADLLPGQGHSQATRFLHEPGVRTLVLYSDESGVGKTHAAYAVGNEAVEHGMFAAAWSMVDFADAIRPDRDPTAYEVAQTCDLLVLDDWGRERLSDWVLERLIGVIDYRWRHEARTVITTQLAGQPFVDRYGDPLTDRIQDGMWYVTVSAPPRRKPAPW